MVENTVLGFGGLGFAVIDVVVAGCSRFAKPNQLQVPYQQINRHHGLRWPKKDVGRRPCHTC